MHTECGCDMDYYLIKKRKLECKIKLMNTQINSA